MGFLQIGCRQAGKAAITVSDSFGTNDAEAAHGFFPALVSAENFFDRGPNVVIPIARRPSASRLAEVAKMLRGVCIWRCVEHVSELDFDFRNPLEPRCAGNWSRHRCGRARVNNSSRVSFSLSLSLSIAIGWHRSAMRWQCRRIAFAFTFGRFGWRIGAAPARICSILSVG